MSPSFTNFLKKQFSGGFREETERALAEQQVVLFGIRTARAPLQATYHLISYAALSHTTSSEGVAR